MNVSTKINNENVLQITHLYNRVNIILESFFLHNINNFILF